MPAEVRQHKSEAGRQVKVRDLLLRVRSVREVSLNIAEQAAMPMLPDIKHQHLQLMAPEFARPISLRVRVRQIQVLRLRSRPQIIRDLPADRARLSKGLRIRYIMPVVRARDLPVRFRPSPIPARVPREVRVAETARGRMLRQETVLQARELREVRAAETARGRMLRQETVRPVRELNQDPPETEGQPLIAETQQMDRELTARAEIVREARAIRGTETDRDLMVTDKGLRVRVETVLQARVARDLTETDLPVKVVTIIKTDRASTGMATGLREVREALVPMVKEAMVRARVDPITDPADSKADREAVALLPEPALMLSRRMRMISRAMAIVRLKREPAAVAASVRISTSRFWTRRWRRRVITAEAGTELIRINY